jgi:septal ring factor EnvC (AmiA/AmiB activator)
MATEGHEDVLDFVDEDLRSFEQDDMVKAALAKGVDLRQYAKSVDDELRTVERDSIMDYIAEAEELATLHTQIKQCDTILDSMESMLSGFQGDLANISSEIKHLQDESISINIRLRNRKAVEGQLSDFINQAVIPPSLVTNICAAEVNEAYIEYILELNSKVRFSKQESSQRTMAYRDIATDIEKLRARAAMRMRDFLLQKIGARRARPERLRAPTP